MIRPIDLQNTLLAVQSAPSVQRAEHGQRIDAQAGQAALEAEFRHRTEQVAPASALLGNRVGAKENDPERQDSHANRRPARKPRTFFEQAVDDAAGSTEEPAHLVDCTA